VRGYRSENELLADPAVDAVLIASPNGVHYHQIKAALAAGKSILVEKTFCDDYEKTCELLAEAAAKKKLAAECLMYLYHPQFSVAKAMIENIDVVGRIATVSVRFGFPHLPSSNIRYSAALAGGALRDMGAYCISAVSQLFDSEPYVSWAAMDTAAGYDVDTGGCAILTLADGIRAFCDWGFDRAYSNQIEIWGERARITVEHAFSKPATSPAIIRVIHQIGNRDEVVTIEPANHFVIMLENFAKAFDDPAATAKLACEVRRQSAIMGKIVERAQR
jgi:dTDP-3,4-didehydro-2,6-dideoxy-alpha-D-glucose 3-reductase